MDAPGGTAAPGGSVVLRLHAPLRRAHARCLVQRLLPLVSDGGLVVCEVSGPPDLGTVDVLARLRLVTRRRGCRLQVRGAPGDLAALAGLLRATGLHDALAAPLQASGQPEPGEQPGVEEVVDVDHLPA